MTRVMKTKGGNMIFRKTMTYDVRCYDLAEHFLQGEPEDVVENRIDLAKDIQRAIEEWFLDKRSGGKDVSIDLRGRGYQKVAADDPAIERAGSDVSVAANVERA
jgi:hypothetical protein